MTDAVFFAGYFGVVVGHIIPVVVHVDGENIPWPQLLATAMCWPYVVAAHILRKLGAS